MKVQAQPTPWTNFPLRYVLPHFHVTIASSLAPSSGKALFFPCSQYWLPWSSVPFFSLDTVSLGDFIHTLASVIAETRMTPHLWVQFRSLCWTPDPEIHSLLGNLYLIASPFTFITPTPVPIIPISVTRITVYLTAQARSLEIILDSFLLYWFCPLNLSPNIHISSFPGHFYFISGLLQLPKWALNLCYTPEWTFKSKPEYVIILLQIPHCLPQPLSLGLSKLLIIATEPFVTCPLPTAQTHLLYSSSHDYPHQSLWISVSSWDSPLPLVSRPFALSAPSIWNALFFPTPSFPSARLTPHPPMSVQRSLFPRGLLFTLDSVLTVCSPAGCTSLLMAFILLVVAVYLTCFLKARLRLIHLFVPSFY